MAQAKVLNEKEIRKVLLHIASKKHSSRNRCMFLMTTNCGMRVGEVAALRICDVLTSDGQIVEEIRLIGINQITFTPIFFKTGKSFVKALKVPSLEYCLMFASYRTECAMFCFEIGVRISLTSGRG